jgi:hypothetical protein
MGAMLFIYYSIACSHFTHFLDYKIFKVKNQLFNLGQLWASLEAFPLNINTKFQLSYLHLCLKMYCEKTIQLYLVCEGSSISFPKHGFR